jgi:hypothetical protein
MQIRIVLLCLLMLPLLPLAAAQAASPEKKPEPKPGSGAPPWAQAGKADAQAAFARQAASAPKPAGDKPAITGEYLWSGRADENYKPFFMWEFRLKAGSAALSGLQARVTTLDPKKQAQSPGAWKPLPSLAAGGALDFDFKINCPTFNAFQVELTWTGGKETFLAWDKLAVPVALGELTGTSFLVSLNQNFEHDPASGKAQVSYSLWNIGGQPGQEVVQTIRFKDDKGKDVFTYDHKPEKGLVPAGFVGEQKLVVSKVPAFATISIGTKSSDLATVDPGSFTGAKDIEIAKVRAEGKLLKARVRNGTGADVDGVTVTITLQTREGKAVKAIDLPVGRLAKGEEKELSTDISGVPAWSGYEAGWASSAPPAAAPAPVTSAPAKLPVLDVDGVRFAVAKAEPGKDGLVVRGTLTNQRASDLEGLTVVFQVADGGKPVTVELKPGALGKGEELAIDFTAAGVKALSGLTMTWKSVTPGKPEKKEAKK